MAKPYHSMELNVIRLERCIALVFPPYFPFIDLVNKSVHKLRSHPMKMTVPHPNSLNRVEEPLRNVANTESERTCESGDAKIIQS